MERDSIDGINNSCMSELYCPELEFTKMKLKLQNFELRESHNNALRALANRHGLNFHDSFFEHPIEGRIPNFAHVTGEYQGYGIFVGFVQITSRTGFSVIELVFEDSSLPARATPIVMKRIPPQEELGAYALNPAEISKYFNCPDLEILSGEIRNQLLIAGNSARMLVVDHDRIRMVPRQDSKSFGTPPPGLLLDTYQLQKCIDLVYSLAVSLGAKKFLAPSSKLESKIPQYVEVARRDYPLASRKNYDILLGAVVLALVLFYLWRKLG